MKTVADVQERLQQRVAELDLEVHADEFKYCRKRKIATGRPGRHADPARGQAGINPRPARRRRW